MNNPEPSMEISSDQVAAYLRDNRSFFVDHPGLLSDLNLPHASGRAVSLVERQVDILRERNMDMRKRLNELLANARHNDELFHKTCTLTLALLDATSLASLNEVLATHVLVDFDADFVCCHIASPDGPGKAAIDHILFHSQPFAFAQLIANDETTCTALREAELASVFPNARHDEPGSAVLLPFECEGRACVLCIGSRDSSRFVQSMDTLFVNYIADVLGKVLPQCLRA